MSTHLKNLLEHVRKITGETVFTEEEAARYFSWMTVSKKQQLMQEEAYCNQLFFVNQGCLHLYLINDKGHSQTVQFAIENWWLTDFEAFGFNKRSSYSLQALESSELLVITQEDFNRLCQDFPLMDRYFRLIYQRAYSASLFRIRYMHNLPKEEFYRMFERKYPDFIQRVPQKVLATFMGLTPEYLSELRSKKIS